MKSKQLFFVLTGVLVVCLVGIVGVAYAAHKLLGSQAHTLATLKGTSQAYVAEQATLAKNKQDIAKYSQLNTIAETIVPQDKDQAEAVREIVNIAAANGITKLSSITFPSSTLGGPVGTPSTSDPGLSQLSTVPSIPGVLDLPITVTQNSNATVPYEQFINFLSSLEQNRRTAQVSSVSVSPDPNNSTNVSFTLVIDEYIKP